MASDRSRFTASGLIDVKYYRLQKTRKTSYDTLRAGPELWLGLRGNPVRIRGCPAAVNENEILH